jgi:hypothetical protein
LIGMHKLAVTDFSPSLLYELLKSLSGVVLHLDDPIKKGKKAAEQRDTLENILWGLYNGRSRKVRGNEQTPHTNLITSSNVAPGEDNQAAESRLIKFHFPARSVNPKGYAALSSAMNKASGGLSQLLAIGYDSKAVKDIEARLLEYLPNAHARIAWSLALVTYFTQKFADTAGITFDAFTYCVSHLCPMANEYESDKDSLQDFLEKLEIMHSEGAVGEWNVTQVTSGGKQYLAVHLAGIWGEFDRKFNPNYSRQSIQQLAEGLGGQTATQKFVSDKLTWIEYKRADAEYDRRDLSLCDGNPPPRPVRPVKSSPRKCLLIPSSIVPWLETNFSSYREEAEFTKVTHAEGNSAQSYQNQVTDEIQVQTELQPEVTSVTQVTADSVPSIAKGARVEIWETKQTGRVVELDGDFATIKLDTPLQERQFQGCEVSKLRLLPSFKVGDRVRYNFEFWTVFAVRPDGRLQLDHATMQKATTANSWDVEVASEATA